VSKLEAPGVEEGKPLRIHELDVESLAQWLCDNKVRTTQGKLIQPLHEGHKIVLDDDARFKVLAAGRRFGKTLLTSLMALSVLMQMNRRVWILGPDYGLSEKVFREIYNILVTQLKIIEPGKPGKGRARYQKGDFYLQTPWGSVLEAKSMERPDSLAGEALDFIIIDEAALDNNLENIWNQMLQPTLMDKEGSAIFISTPRGRNSFYKLYLMGQTGLAQKNGTSPITTNDDGISNDMTDWSSFQRTSYDNPLLSSTPEKSREEVDAAYRRAVLSGKVVQFKQEYLADFEAVSDIVFPGFITEVTETKKYSNVVDYDWHPDNGPIYAACDHNFAKPAATIFAQINQYGDVIIFDERFTKHTTTQMQGQQIVNKQADLHKKAVGIWQKDEVEQKFRRHIHFEKVVADVSGNQVQLNGRAAWDDMEVALGYRPVGLKQPRDIGANMMRTWMQFPQFDEKGKPLFDEHKEQITVPKLFVNRGCVNTIYALTTAKFKAGKSGILKEDYAESPEGYEGLLDAIRYLMVYLFHDRGNHISITGGF